MTDQEAEEICEGLDLPDGISVEFLCDGETMLIADLDSGEIYSSYTLH